MPPELCKRARAAVVALTASLAMTAIAGCTSMTGGKTDGGGDAPLAAPDRASVQAQALAFYLELLHRFSKAGPGEQAEIFANIRRDFDTQPTPSSRLRLALALATPDHAATDPERAQAELRSLLEEPQLLSPAEHAAAYLELLKLDRQLGLLAETRRLAAESGRDERERLATLTRRLQAENEENARLRRALDDAQAKLDAIAAIEGGTATRRPSRTPAPSP